MKKEPHTAPSTSSEQVGFQFWLVVLLGKARITMKTPTDDVGTGSGNIPANRTYYEAN